MARDLLPLDPSKVPDLAPRAAGTRTLFVTIPAATDGNAAVWLLVGTEIALLVDRVPASARKTAAWSRAFSISPGAHDVVLRVTGRRPERGWSIVVEQTWALSESGVLTPVASNASDASVTWHPRVGVKQGGPGAFATVEVDLKVVDITAALQPSPVAPPSPSLLAATPPPLPRYYEITSGQPRAWLAVGPVVATWTTWLVLFRTAVDPLDDASASRETDLAPHFSPRGVARLSTSVFYHVESPQPSAIRLPGVTPASMPARLLGVTVAPLFDRLRGANPPDWHPFGCCADDLLGSLLRGLWTDGVLPVTTDKDGAPIAVTFVAGEERELERRILRRLRDHFGHFQSTSDEQLMKLMGTGRARAASYGIRSPYGIAVYVGLMAELGTDFDTGGKYPWAAEILNDSRIDGNAKVDLICKRALSR